MIVTAWNTTGDRISAFLRSSFLQLGWHDRPYAVIWLLLPLAISVAPAPALAWGAEGHRVVALIAASRLSPAARAGVQSLLEGDATTGLERESTWADEIRRHRPDTAPWHYVDIELSSHGYESARDCLGGACVVAQVQKEAAVLADRKLAQPIRAEALRFLVHFVADLHQPLHAADNHDRGGNDVRVVLGRKKTNLHSVWDVSVVGGLGDNPGDIAGKLEQQISPEDQLQWSMGSVSAWASQSFEVAKSRIYTQLPGSGATDAPIVLGPKYPKDQSIIVKMQLERAGVRLAVLLNRALEDGK